MIGRVVSLTYRISSVSIYTNFVLDKGFDYDFKCGDSPEAKELGALWDNQSQMAVTFAGFMVLGTFIDLWKLN